MPYNQLLDSVPILGLFVMFAVIGFITSESGYRLGRWWQQNTPDEKEGPTSMIVGAILALLGFLLAITMGMASDRFDARRGLVLNEANSVGTTYLRAGYLPEPASSEIKNLLREYVPLRIVDTNNLSNVSVRMVRSAEIHAQLWSITEELARTSPESNVLALFIDSLNETIDLHETRIMVGIYGRVPETVLLLLIFGFILTLSMVGFNAGLSLKRSPFSATALILMLGASITLVIDIDRPQDGFLKVSQHPLLDLEEQIGIPPQINLSE
jgi:hypothetical protein